MEGKPDTSSLFSSAKTVAEAVQASIKGETDKIDKANVAGAAGDLVGAASEYGHLKEKGYGQYVEKVEGYLQQYKTQSGSTTTVAAVSVATAEAPAKPEEPGHEAESGGGGGFGALKTQQDGDSQPEGGGGLGDVLKKAGSFF